MAQDYRSFDDTLDLRQRVLTNAQNAIINKFPLQNDRLAIELTDVGYTKIPDFDLPAQKQAIMHRRTLDVPLKGTYIFRDPVTGEVLGKKRKVVARVPWMTPRGTFIYNGVEWVMANQQRLRPGVYARQKDNGEVEAHVNLMPGTGRAFRVYMDPATGIFKAKLGQANIPMYSLLKSLGATDDQVRKYWGDDLLRINIAKSRDADITRAAQKFVGAYRLEGKKPDEALREAFAGMQIDPEVSQRNLGKPYDKVDLEVLLRTTQKLLNITKGLEDVDDRDDQFNKRTLGPEDILAERIQKDADKLQRKLLWKLARERDINKLPSGAFTKQVITGLLSSGLGMTPEQINPLEIVDSLHKVTGMGEGGVASTRGITDESRGVQPTQFGIIDPIKAVESVTIGVDNRVAAGVMKGSDGKLYRPVLDAQGNEHIVSAQDLVRSKVAFPGELQRPGRYARVMHNGRIRRVLKSKVDYVLPSTSDMYSPATNLVPMLSGVKGQRGSMGARMMTQALSITGREAPLVRAATPDGASSFEAKYGALMGAVFADKAGRVVEVTDDYIKIKTPSGKTYIKEIYNNMPSNRKTLLHNTAKVKVGDTVKAGQLLAGSNYTDDQGVTALGTNLRVAFLPMDGTHEDALVISESAAKKLTGENLYQVKLDTDKTRKIDKKSFMGKYSSKFSREQFNTIDDNGVVKPGTVVKHGDPLVLAVDERRAVRGSTLRRHAKSVFRDASKIWTKDSPGIVTDTAVTSSGVKVAVKVYNPMNVADKLCYAHDTDVLTTRGWVPVAEVTKDDLVYALSPRTQQVEFVKPVEIYSYAHKGPMYTVETEHAALCVTPNHKLYISAAGRDYALTEARHAPDNYKLLSTCVGYSDDERVTPDEYIAVLALFLLYGRLDADYDIILDVPESHYDKVKAFIEDKDIPCAYTTRNRVKLIRTEATRYAAVAAVRHTIKRVPFNLLGYGITALPRLFEYMLEFIAADDFVIRGVTHLYAGDIQRLALHYGGMAVAYIDKATGLYDVHIAPHRIADTVTEHQWVEYDGRVYCVQLEKHHILYTRRNGKPVWCGNSGRAGNKGVVGKILPDDQMPRDSEGRPFEIIFNPLGMVSRVNPSLVVYEAILGKLARKRGEPYNMPAFTDDDFGEIVKRELDKHGMSDTERVYDPQTNRYLDNILTGEQFIMRLHHSAEGKLSGRDTGLYTAEGIPTKNVGGDTHDNAQRLGTLDHVALLAHGATETIREAHLVRGQRNDEYWQDLRLGRPLKVPRTSVATEKFMDSLRAAGIRVDRSPTAVNIQAMTDADVDELAGDRVLENADGLKAKNRTPVAGGLFDPRLTGGKDGNKFAKIILAERIPHPLMEEPVRRTLGLTKEAFQKKIASDGGLDWIYRQLDAIDLDKAIAEQRDIIKNKTGTKRDNAVRLLKYYTGAKAAGLHPRDWMITRVPVLPPRFRPVSQLGEVELTADANLLYKDLWDVNTAVKELKDITGDPGESKLQLYKAVKALMGLTDPLSVEFQQKGVRGILAHMLGKGKSPKHGFFQRALMSTPTDSVGRGVIAPSIDLNMDEVGVPEPMAWKIFRPFVIRHMMRRYNTNTEGATLPATEILKLVENKDPLAKKALLDVMADRYVVMARAPVLHKFGIIGQKPVLVPGSTVRVNPSVLAGLGADFDGDTVSIHVPTTDEVQREIAKKMLPSKNLLSESDFDVHMLPRQEYLLGLYEASRGKVKGKAKRRYTSHKDVLSAILRGEIDVHTPVTVG